MKIKKISSVRVCAFTEKGIELKEKLKASWSSVQWNEYRGSSSDDLYSWTEDGFNKAVPFIFICAAGIAVRTIAPFVTDKLKDSAVLVMDEQGKYVIPVLSGHVGMANEIAEIISKTTGAESVITTATDINKKFSIDIFAVRNFLRIINREGIKKVSSQILEGKKIKIFIEDGIKLPDDNPPEEIELISGTALKENVDVAVTIKALNENDNSLCCLNLVPLTLCLGMGCKKGKSFDEIKLFFESFIDRNKDVDANMFHSVSTIDLKENETGLIEFCHYLHKPLYIYSSEELNCAEGSFSDSEFVKETTGTSNVCERSSVLTAGTNGRLWKKKAAFDGITAAVSIKMPEIITWETK